MANENFFCERKKWALWLRFEAAVAGGIPTLKHYAEGWVGKPFEWNCWHYYGGPKKRPFTFITFILT